MESLDALDGMLENDDEVVTTEEAGAGETATDDKEAKKKEQREMKEKFEEAVEKDPTMQERLGKWSNSIHVLNTLGFGENGNLVVDPSSKGKIGDDGKPKRDLVYTSKIVGYRIKNVGTEPITYLTEEYEQTEEGTYVGTKVQRTINPGDTANLARRYFTAFSAYPEISMKFQNGKMVRSSTKADSKDLEQLLDAYYFAFNDKNLKVNSDEIKMNISHPVQDSEGKTRWVVNDEFVKDFGFLNNPEESKSKSRGKGKGKGKEKYDSQDYNSFHLWEAMSKAGFGMGTGTEE